MSMRTLAPALAAGALVLPALALAAASVFLGADAGVAVRFEPVPLPPTVRAPLESTAPWSPRSSELLEGELVIETEAQMDEVWTRLFGLPFDPALVDFDTEFVIWMGGGLMDMGSFSITSVERSTGAWADPFSDGTDPFLAVSSTTVLPGAPNPFPPPPTWRLSAVKLDRSLLDDVVFYRAILALP